MKRAKHITRATIAVHHLPYLVNGDNPATDRELKKLDRLLNDAIVFEEYEGGHKTIIVNYLGDIDSAKYLGIDDINEVYTEVVDVELIQLVEAEPTGCHTVTNSIGYLIETHKSGDYARLLLPRETVNGDFWEVTGWLDIDHVEYEYHDEFIAVIDPDGYHVPYNLVSNINQ